MVQLGLKQLSPAVLLHVERLSELAEIREGETVVIGSLVTQRALAENPLISQKFPSLKSAASLCGGWQTQSVGTIGGNVCNASPAADLIPVLLVHDAIVTLESKSRGERKLPLSKFVLGRRNTARDKDELLTSFELVQPPPFSGCAFVKVGRRSAMEISIVNAAVRISLDCDGLISDVAIAVGSVGPAAFRPTEAEDLIRGRRLADISMGEVAQWGLSQNFVVNGLLTISGEIRAPELWSVPMILNAVTEKLKRQSKDDFKGRHFEAWLIVQAVAWYLRYPLSYRDLEEMFRERGFEVDHSTINRWVLTYAPMIEKRLRQFRRLHCGSVRIDETYVKIRGKWRYLYRAIDKHGNPVDFLLTAKRDLDAAKRFFRKMLKDEPLLSPGKIGTDGANTFPSTIKAAVDDGLLHPDPVHYVTKHLQQGIESDHFRVKKNMPKIGGFQSFNTARRTIAGFEAMLWLRKGFGFSGNWNVNDQNDLLARLFGLQKVNKA